MCVYKFVVFLVIACALSRNANADEFCKYPPRGHPRTCCTFTTNMKIDLLECIEEKRKNNNTCSVDCIVDAVEGVFTNNDIDRDVLVSFTTNDLEGQDPSPLFEETMVKCIVRVKEQKDDDTKPMEDKRLQNRSCIGKLFKLSACLNHEVFLNCPVHMWQSNNQCEEWKDFSSKCPFEFRDVYNPRKTYRKL